MKYVKQSFTLVEILVVIVIIGILSSFIFFTINNSVDKANIAKSKMFSESIRNNLLLNLVSEWKLDGNANDSWGSNNGTATDVTYETETNCISGECGIFNGSTSYVDCGNASSLDITGNLTIEAWIKITGSCSDDCDIFIRGDDSIDGYRLTISLGVIRFDTFSPTKIISRGSAITDNKWHHIVVTKNGTGIGSVKIYNDGIDVTSQQGDHGNPASNNKHAYIGSYNSIAHFLNGEIDEVRVYNSVISESEIEQKYLSGLYIKQ